MNLKAERKLCHLTLRQMSELTQITFTRYCAIEAGKERAKRGEESAIAWILQEYEAGKREERVE
jgi:transcriptional regulator with XRE-family HTH domain